MHSITEKMLVYVCKTFLTDKVHFLFSCHFCKALLGTVALKKHVLNRETSRESFQLACTLQVANIDVVL